MNVLVEGHNTWHNQMLGRLGGRFCVAMTATTHRFDRDWKKSKAQIPIVVPIKYWLVVSIPLKNISPLGSLFPIYGKKCSKPPIRYQFHH
jgi:hypothetical protein